MKKQLFTFIISTAFIVSNAQVYTVSTFAGSGLTGSTNGTGIAASFQYPVGVCSDASGNLYVADRSNNLIRKITPAGVVTTLAGSGASGSTDATGVLASFNSPTGVCVDGSGNVYVGDSQNCKIRKITPAGVVTTVAGSGSPGSANGSGISATFNYPSGICIDPSGNLYVADYNNHKIRIISPSGSVLNLAGSGIPGLVNAMDVSARFNSPQGICIDASGNLYVADNGNHCVRKITVGGNVTTLAGNGTIGSANGTGTLSTFNYPVGICVDASGNLYVGDGNNQKIRKITTSNVVTTFAGDGTSGSTNGPALSANFDGPNGVCLDASGNMFVVDNANQKIRKLTVCTLPPAPTNSTAIGNTSFCNGNTTTLTATGTGTISWHTAPTGSVSIASGSTIVTSNALTPGNYTYYAENNTCAASAIRTPVTFTVNGPIILVATSNTILCIGNSVNLTASGATTYTWNSSETTPVIAVSPTITTSYTVTGTDAGGCINATIFTQNVSSCTGINTLVNDNNLGVQIYPNPSNGLYHLELLTDAELTITNILGEIVSTQKMNSGTQTINIQNEAKGIYFIKISQNLQYQVIKLIKE